LDPAVVVRHDIGVPYHRQQLYHIITSSHHHIITSSHHHIVSYHIITAAIVHHDTGVPYHRQQLFLFLFWSTFI